MMPLHLHINQKSNYDYDIIRKFYTEKVCLFTNPKNIRVVTVNKTLSRPLIKSAYQENSVFSPPNYICCGYSKELSQ